MVKLKDKPTPYIRKGVPPYPVSEQLRILKILQLNGFNLAVTARQTGVSVNSLKKWREEHPEAFSNQFSVKTLSDIELMASSEARKVVATAGNVLRAALKRAEELATVETDLNKISNLVRAVAPLADALKDDNPGMNTVSNLKQSLEKMSRMKVSDSIEDTSFTPV